MIIKLKIIKLEIMAVIELYQSQAKFSNSFNDILYHSAFTTKIFINTSFKVNAMAL